MPGPSTYRVLGETNRTLELNERVGFDTLPDQVVNKALKRGFSFNILCVGETGLGKSTLIESLFKTDFSDDAPETHENDGVGIKVHRTKLSDGGVDLDLTVVHTTGFGDQLDRTNTAEAVIKYIDEQSNLILQEELKTTRDLTTLHDSRIHVCLYFLAPTGRSLKSLDLQVMKQLQDKVNLVPVIAKADSITKPELADFKALLRREFEENKIRIYEPEEVVDGISFEGVLPFAVITSRDTITAGEETVRVRQYPWGIVEVENEEHSDFVKLRELLLRTHMERLRQRTRTKMYEAFRHTQMEQMGFVDTNADKPASIKDTYEQKKLEHLRELQLKEDQMRQLFVQKVKKKEAQLKSAEQEIAKRYERVQAEHAETQRQLAAEFQVLERERQMFHEAQRAEEHGKKKKDKKNKH